MQHRTAQTGCCSQRRCARSNCALPPGAHVNQSSITMSSASSALPAPAPAPCLAPYCSRRPPEPEATPSARPVMPLTSPAGPPCEDSTTQASLRGLPLTCFVAARPGLTSGLCRWPPSNRASAAVTACALSSALRFCVSRFASLATPPSLCPTPTNPFSCPRLRGLPPLSGLPAPRPPPEGIFCAPTWARPPRTLPPFGRLELRVFAGVSLWWYSWTCWCSC